MGQREWPRAPILVVEDYEDTRRSVEELLRAHGYATTSVADAASALYYLHANPACLIVLDLHMPGRSGKYLLHQFRKGDDPDVLLAAVEAHCRNMCRC